jgi:hypothetical protein
LGRVFLSGNLAGASWQFNNTQSTSSSFTVLIVIELLEGARAIHGTPAHCSNLENFRASMKWNRPVDQLMRKKPYYGALRCVLQIRARDRTGCCSHTRFQRSKLLAEAGANPQSKSVPLHRAILELYTCTSGEVKLMYKHAMSSPGSAISETPLRQVPFFVQVAAILALVQAHRCTHPGEHRGVLTELPNRSSAISGSEFVGCQ